MVASPSHRVMPFEWSNLAMDDLAVWLELEAPMWRFALKLADAAKCIRQDLLQADVAEDFDFSSAVRAFHSGEVVFVVQAHDAVTVDQAVQFIRGLCNATPTRLWLDGEEIDPLTGAPI